MFAGMRLGGGGGDPSRSRNNSSSSIMANMPLEELLDTEDVLKKCRELVDYNLSQYLTRDDIIAKLIQYVTVEPSENQIDAIVQDHLHRQKLEKERLALLKEQQQQQQQQNSSSSSSKQSKQLAKKTSGGKSSGSAKQLPATPPTPPAATAKPLPTATAATTPPSDGTVLSSSSHGDDNSESMDGEDGGLSAAEREEQEKERQLVIEKITYKYPHIACEILESVVGKTYILPKVVETQAQQISRQADMELDKQQSHMDHLFSFIEQVTPLPQHLARHFIKLVITMIKIPSLTSKIMSYIYSDEGRMIKCLVKHVSTTDEICELLLMCLLYEREDADDDDDGASSDDSDSDNNTATTNSYINSISEINTSDWAIKQSILSVLISLLLTEQYCENVAAIISTILTLARPSMLINELLKKETISQIIDNLIACANSTEVFSEGMEFLGTLIIHSQQGDDSVKVLFNNLHRFVDLLDNPVPQDPIQTTWGKLETPLGVCRLKIIEFFVIVFKHYKELVQIHPNIDIKGRLRDCGVLRACVDLFFKFEKNNILHNLVTHIITCVLENGYTEFIKILLNEQTNLARRIVEAYQRSKQVQRTERQSLGYMGHITIIENFLNNLESEEYKQKLLSVEGWGQITEELREKHFIECIYRHGGNISLPPSYMKTQFGVDEEAEEEEGQSDDSDDDDTDDDTDDATDIDNSDVKFDGHGSNDIANAADSRDNEDEAPSLVTDDIEKTIENDDSDRDFDRENVENVELVVQVSESSDSSDDVENDIMASNNDTTEGEDNALDQESNILPEETAGMSREEVQVQKEELQTQEEEAQTQEEEAQVQEEEESNSTEDDSSQESEPSPPATKTQEESHEDTNGATTTEKEEEEEEHTEQPSLISKEDM